MQQEFWQEISKEAIAKKAYQFWIERGRDNNFDAQNWSDAERALAYAAYESRKSDQELINTLRAPQI